MSKTLFDEELESAMNGLPEWSLWQGELVREVTFEDFKRAMTFVNRVAFQAEVAEHHPDIDIRYNRVRLALVTHDAGGITESDIKMAGEIDRIALQ